jgi:hypothetical protein
MPGALLFVPGYFALLVASTIGYALRNRGDVIAAVWRGAAAGMRGEQGQPPDWVFGSGPRGHRVDERPRA